MADNSGDYFKGFLLGSFIGGTIGAITALLLAPKSGKELRQDLAVVSNDLYDKASDYFSNVETSVGSIVSNTVNEGRTRADNIIRSARSKAEDILQSADKVMQDAKIKAESAKETIQQKIGQIQDATVAGAEAFKNEWKSNTAENS